MSMSPEEYAAYNRKKIEELRTRNKPLEIAVRTSVAQITKRAFSDKRNDKGEFFRYNSMDPIYVRQEQSPKKLSNKGKFGRDTFKSGEKKGQKHTTTYFASYKEFRETVRLESEIVNWQLNNDLRSDYGNSPKNTPVNKLKPAVKIDVNHYVTQLSRDINIKKYEGLSDRFGDFLKCSESEKQDFYRIQELELGKFLST